MSMLLQVVLSLSIATLTVFLVLLLLQARRTAQSVQQLAESARQDLHQIAGDVHEVRLKVEAVADLAEGALGLPSTLTQLVAGVVRGLPAWFAPRHGSGRILESLLTGLREAVHWFRVRKAEPTEEGSHA